MPKYSLGHLQDHVLLRDLASLVVRDRQTTAELLAHIAEVEARKLYRPKAYSCMHEYCVRELRMSEDMAFKRIQAARAARRHPEILFAVAEGRLHLTAVVLLAPHLEKADPRELIAAATHKTKAQVELMLAGRFPVGDVPTVLTPVSGSIGAAPAPTPNVSGGSPAISLVPEPAAPTNGVHFMVSMEPESSTKVPGPGNTMSAGVSAVPFTRLAPLSATRFALQVTIADVTREKLRRAQELLGHAVPSGDLAQVLDRALDAWIAKLEKRK